MTAPVPGSARAPGPAPDAPALAERAVELPAQAWDALVGADDFYLTSRWLRVIEETSGAAMGYLTAGPPHLPRAALATAHAQTSAPWLSGRPDTLLQRCVKEEQPGAAEFAATLTGDATEALMPALVCGGRHLGRNRVLVPAGHVGEQDAARLVRAAEDRARTLGARSVAFLYVDERDTALRELLATRGYRCFRSGRYSWLPLPEGGLDGYLATLSGHRRRRILAERRQLRAVDVRVEIEPLHSGSIARLAALEAELLTKYGMRWLPRQSEEIFGQVLTHVGEHAQVSVARRDGDVLGFALLLRHRDQWFAHRAGFDYEAQGNLPVYFETLFYRPAELAAEFGVTAVHYGTGSVAAKQSRGCAAVDQHAFVLPLEDTPAQAGPRSQGAGG
ncbi:GNAT family N-acetyltransferase [Streptomyces sp. NPDC046197]|uniref:GNAT family N-acetyltransferase n=1 Tax=Streptomyces sp. NPDC046197 TaxID=3154337 RepID=UPI0033CE6C25